MKEQYIISLIKDYAIKYGKAPTAASFSKEYNIFASAIIRRFNISWNNLLLKADLKVNKASKRSKEDLLAWLKSHPDTKYSQVPTGIRGALEEYFGSISNAREAAGLSITDWRGLSKTKKTYSENTGRPLEYSKEIIIDGLQELANKLNRPPKMKDINKQSCGFTVNVLLSRFDSFNNALKAAGLPLVYSYHEENKLLLGLQTLIINIKISLNDIPTYYEIDYNKPTFIYSDRIEFVKLTRSEIESDHSLIKYKEKINVLYLVDDSLYENSKITMICVFDFIEKLDDEILINKIKELRLKYDEINRKYIGQPLSFIK
jgi:hypothetical protein